MLALAEPQERAIAHRDGPLLLIGEAGTGKTEVLARRFESLVADGTAPERILVLASTRATAQRLRERVEQLLDRPLEELWIGTWEQLCERLLREHSTAAGLDPFFAVLGPAERLALLLDRIDELPLRGHEIRGNPAGLLARLLEQIDAVKAGAEPPEPELAELIAAHDRILAGTCSLDRGDVYLTLSRLLDEHPRARADISHRFEYLMVDELEDTNSAQRAILAALAGENPNHLYAVEGGSPGGGGGGGGVLGGGGAGARAGAGGGR
jgi:DNA helicase-2/ATP-dependent DNA helicase PcrA